MHLRTVTETMPVSNNKPLVTIAVPSYNHASYIEACINSIVLQTYSSIELIVLDDGSNDDSAAILQRLSEQHGFYFEHQQNIGLPATMDKALAMAKGKYFAVFESDDIAMLDRIEKQVRYMEQDETIGLCAGNMLKINDAGVLLKKQQFHDYRELQFDDLFLNLKPGCATPTMMLRTDSVRAVGGYNLQLKVEDVYIQLKISEAGYKIISINDICCYYRIHDSNMHKDLHFMVENVLLTFACFKDRENYQLAVNKFLESMFLKAAKKDKKLAWELFNRIKPKRFSTKLVRGLIKLAF